MNLSKRFKNESKQLRNLSNQSGTHRTDYGAYLTDSGTYRTEYETYPSKRNLSKPLYKKNYEPIETTQRRSGTLFWYLKVRGGLYLGDIVSFMILIFRSSTIMILYHRKIKTSTHFKVPDLHCVGFPLKILVNRK